MYLIFLINQNLSDFEQEAGKSERFFIKRKP